MPAAFMTGAILAAIALVSLLIGKGVFGVSPAPWCCWPRASCSASW